MIFFNKKEVIRMGIKLEIPEVSLGEKELKILLAIKLFEEGIVSLGKASEIAGYTVKAFSELLLSKGIPPITFDEDIDLEKEVSNV